MISCQPISWPNQIGDAIRKMNGEGQKARSHQTDKELFAPIGLVHFGKNADIVMEQIAEAAGRQQHTKANAGPSQKHHYIYKERSKKPGHGAVVRWGKASGGTSSIVMPPKPTRRKILRCEFASAPAN